MRDASIQWFALLALGAAHGINPAMGWLFAVGRGLQERDRRAVWRALGPLAIGHALAIGVAIAAAMAMGNVLPLGWLRWVVALSLVGVGVDGLVHHRHVRLGGMRVGSRELATWSFLMASAHGAGLMVLPFVLGTAPATDGAMHHHHAASLGAGAPAQPLAAGITGFDSIAVIAPLVHTLGYLLVTVVLAVVVYEKVGLKILRRAWINVNVFWSAALIAAGAAAVLL
ncbi:MAG TPA: hypothetical protein VKA54_11870 [Gemmatimonadaceae bacterium]|nr:hypothetical protein [Gemmatimonadaceae bacterium]